jgi:predicted MFS family arabinose efflux permease
MDQARRRRWLVVVVFFFFMLLHQSDRLLIGSLPDQIRETYGINRTQFGLVISGALLVSTIMYPIWGYLYDRFARPKLLALASFIWGSTTWLSAIAPNFGTFLVTRATTGIDDSSYPGLYSLISDYFGPGMRGKIYGLLQIAQPLGFMMGMVLALTLGGTYGWQRVFFLTGSLGIVLAIVIFFAVRDVPRGRAEPEMEDLERVGVYRFDWSIAKGLFRKRSLLLLFAQGFAGVFPWQVITYFFIDYLSNERGYAEDSIMLTMGIAILVLSVGYFLGGALGDFFFKRTPRGRLLVSTVGVLLGAVMLYFTLGVPTENHTLFLLMLSGTVIFIPIASANTVSTVHDITLPEVRSTALSVQFFMENIGAATAPALAGFIADRSSLSLAILVICISAWLLCSLLLGVAAYLVPKDIRTLRSEMGDRAEEQRRLQASPN